MSGLLVRDTVRVGAQALFPLSVLILTSFSLLTLQKGSLYDSPQEDNNVVLKDMKVMKVELWLVHRGDWNAFCYVHSGQGGLIKAFMRYEYLSRR